MEFASLRHSASAVPREIPASIREALAAAEAGSLRCQKCKVRPSYGSDGRAPLCRTCLDRRALAHAGSGARG